ncbi:hypothetical protein C8J57DRAFT_1471368 [Mycena rebaudengoi]|nr:hypothetical protein C8J57DRAFT_1471368 [Mycena rebaudengoi]
MKFFVPTLVALAFLTLALPTAEAQCTPPPSFCCGDVCSLPRLCAYRGNLWKQRDVHAIAATSGSQVERQGMLVQSSIFMHLDATYKLEIYSYLSFLFFFGASSQGRESLTTLESSESSSILPGFISQLEGDPPGTLAARTVQGAPTYVPAAVSQTGIVRLCSWPLWKQFPVASSNTAPATNDAVRDATSCGKMRQFLFLLRKSTFNTPNQVLCAVPSFHNIFDWSFACQAFVKCRVGVARFEQTTESEEGDNGGWVGIGFKPHLDQIWKSRRKN